MSLLQSHSAAGKMGISGWPGRGRVPCSRRLWHGRGVAQPCQLQNADCDAGLSMLPNLLQLRVSGNMQHRLDSQAGYRSWLPGCV